ncbi:hypothetical protein [Devosia aurantiaca]|uniref:AsmA-like C-terminal domain-containing protein n=1 Tax=Devosia aurantiaca TaxID=2714858 RepID=A0A6M1SZG0_9HYPH|nr:hypothetical protein [Devosia aurantiaca]NGP18031.1 hypothetical protein [Devosia aurantiaca]
MLSEVSAPPLPPIPGRLGIDLAEATLRGFALRNVRIDATTDGRSWAIEQAVANLPGETELRVSGTVTSDAGSAGFAGDLAMTSQRLDALSALWRKPQDNNPLFNQPGSLNGRLLLAGNAFGLTGGALPSRARRIRLRCGSVLATNRALTARLLWAR